MKEPCLQINIRDYILKYWGLGLQRLGGGLEGTVQPPAGIKWFVSLSVFVIWKTKRLRLEEESFCLEGGVEYAREKE